MCVSPALHGAWSGDTTLEAALTRYLIAVPICWLVLSIFEAMVGPPPRPQPPVPAPTPEAAQGPTYTAQQVPGMPGTGARQLGAGDDASA
ncbi:hypothetical protein [Nocardioides bruguierae]|uniref:hypothetical protein n=1 Tax=Nocardioides bruguierae TaxID=2945102 RepID=UPI0020225635|nr:hypothetical protein [Nocardioides bruguierae]MCL8027679.1 hypothetical protein [Nocardioides bruguierae]